MISVIWQGSCNHDIVILYFYRTQQPQHISSLCLMSILCHCLYTYTQISTGKKFRSHCIYNQTLNLKISSYEKNHNVKSPLRSRLSLTLCLVGWILRKVENTGRKMGWKSGFSSVRHWMKNRRVENPGEKFLSRAHNFFPPDLGGKAREENCVPAILLECPLINPSFKTFTYPTEDFCPK